MQSHATARIYHAARRRGSAWPLAARAQQPAMPVIGFLDAASPVAWTGPAAWISPGPEGHGLRRGRERGDRLPLGGGSTRSAAGAGGRSGSRPSLRDRHLGIATALAAKAATTTIPIVFGVSEDPVRLGLVASLARPGGNLTGINFLSTELAAKRLELLRELVPAAMHIAVLVNPANPANASPR